ncbi:hypothetical protein GO755_18955 [Spirosoma sp. HMF4905]|uniref:Uncharacterized protein n=1 Tax=Spirosoma arboris TaxID=2682092 RepID=A0A7K1SEA1_9BACT|nr:hypothetical protein [Spirosoma arboris]MVM32137.1 hypothetical protein [Spirosoma arboris]
MVIFTHVWAQTIAQPPIKPIHCPPLEEPARIEKVVNGVLYDGIDSTALQKEIDSTYAQLKGRWFLYQLQGGWSAPNRTDRQITMTIDELGHAVIVEQNKPLAIFQFKLRRDWQSIYTPIVGRNQSFFLGMTRGLIVEVCQDTLVLNEALGDGLEYVFKR